MLLPGPAHPHPRRAPADLGAWLGVNEARVQRWVAGGLPAPGGTIDAFQAVNWLNDRLDEAPVLRSRWRRFLRWFQPFIAGTDRAAVRQVVRHHRLCLPRAPRTITWWLPRLPDETWDVPAEVSGAHVRLATDRATGTSVVPCAPLRQPLPELVPLVEEVVAGFTYGYRHHRPDDDYHGRTAGSCLDLTFALGDRLAERGRTWRPCFGVIAHTALANPHFWLEVETADGWVPIDPSLPAIARTFAEQLPEAGDWREWVRAYTGGRDARRITVLRGEAPLGNIPSGATLGSIGGEALVDGENAWLCMDWVCGECRWEFG